VVDHVAGIGDFRNLYKNLSKNFTRMENSGDLGVEGSIVLKLTLKI